MKKEVWNEGMNHIDSDIVEEYVIQKEKFGEKKKRKRGWLQWSLTAACLCLAAILVFAVSTRTFSPGQRYIVYNADKIGAFFDSAMDGLTNTYEEVYVPSVNHLKAYNLLSIPSEKYLDIYETDNTKELNQEELKDFMDPILGRFAGEANIEIPEYQIEKEPSYNGYDFLSAKKMKNDRFLLYATQRAEVNSFGFTQSFSALKDGSIKLGNVKIEVDQTKTDEEILSGIKPIQDKLFYIFDRKFSDVKILRKYDDDNKEGVYTLDIYFYNEDDHPLNPKQAVPVSDYIYMEFDNINNGTYDIVSDTILTVVRVGYQQHRTNIKELYYGKMISLEEAEELLYKGYVFGNPVCSICMQNQELVDFHDYDLVGFEYLDSDNSTEILPFYAFYKKIGTSDNGNEVYAKTYVAAIEVTGYDEYFQKQHENHK